MHFTILFFLHALIQLSHALCPGYNYAFFNMQAAYQKDPMSPAFFFGPWSFMVTDDSCLQVACCLDSNPCDGDCKSMLHCAHTGAITHVDGVTVDGLR